MRFLVVGCGRMGSGLAEALTLAGHTVAVVDRDPATFARLPASFSGAKVAGLANDPEALRQAGIERADGLAAVTASDDANVACARLAREQFRVPRVVARVYDPQQAAKYQRSGLPTVSTTTWGVERVADLLCYSPLEVVFSVPTGDVDLLEAEILPPVAGHSVRDLAMHGEAAVVAVTRDTHSFLPYPSTVLEPGDHVYIAAVRGAAERLRAMLAAA